MQLGRWITRQSMILFTQTQTRAVTTAPHFNCGSATALSIQGLKTHPLSSETESNHLIFNAQPAASILKSLCSTTAAHNSKLVILDEAVVHSTHSQHESRLQRRCICC